MNSSPVTIVKSASQKFNEMAIPLTAFASIMLPFFNSAVNADEVATPAAPVEKIVLGPIPTDWGLAFNDFYSDCNKVCFVFIDVASCFLQHNLAQVIGHMRYAIQMEKGNPALAEVTHISSPSNLDPRSSTLDLS